MNESHLVAGSLAVLAGFVALFARKGGELHRSAGRAFVVAMLFYCLWRLNATRMQALPAVQEKAR